MAAFWLPLGFLGLVYLMVVELASRSGSRMSPLWTICEARSLEIPPLPASHASITNFGQIHLTLTYLSGYNEESVEEVERMSYGQSTTNLPGSHAKSQATQALTQHSYFL